MKASGVLDVRRFVTQLDQPHDDERADQIADWAVYGTLLSAALTVDDMRE